METENNGINATSKFFAWLLVICALNNIFIYTPSISQMAYYAIMIVLNVILLFTNIGKPMSISTGMWGFWVIMWLSIVFNYGTIPAVFRAEERTIAFFGVMLVLGPWILCRKLVELRLYIWRCLNKCLFVMVMFSFVGRIGGFLPSDANGYFLGCFAHSMILAPLAALVCLNCLHESINSENVVLGRIMGGCSVIALAVIFFASSRTSLVATFIAIFTYLNYQVSGRNNVVIRNLLFFCIILGVISYLAGGMMDGIRNKQQGEFNMSNTVASRAPLWEARISEIKSSPMFGIGSHSVSGKNLDPNGQIEPGNGWLFAFSSMGIFAFLTLLGIMGMSFIQLRADIMERKRKVSVLLISQIVFWTVYMNGEAHITAAGNFTYLYYWLEIGICLGIYRYLETKDPEKENKLFETALSR